jgi:hypothetical protein
MAAINTIVTQRNGLMAKGIGMPLFTLTGCSPDEAPQPGQRLQ